MHQLTGLDTSFLAMETATVTGHVGSVQILDPSTAKQPLNLENFITTLAPRVDVVPMTRRKLVQVPFGLDNPYWVDDPDFDIEFHIRELALPAPGSMRQLTEQVARLHARPLDRARPLWEMYLISGLEHGRVALYTKMHHAAIDGVAGNELLEALLDTSPEGRELPPTPDHEREEIPSQSQLLARGLGTVATHPARLARLGAQLIRSVPAIASTNAPDLPGLRRFVGRGDDTDLLRPSPGLRAPATPFNAPITGHRRIALTEVSLSGVKRIKDATGSTLNDVVLSLCAGGLRRWLLDHDALPADPLVGGIPVSVRTEEQQGTSGNRVSMMFAALPTNLDDPLDRINAASQASRVAKEKFGAVPATLLIDMAQFTFPSLTDQAFRLAVRLRLVERARPFNLIISNVPGPRMALFTAGAALLEYYPLSAIADGQGLNITVFSYRDQIFFGLLACRELVPDLDAMADAIIQDFDELSAAVSDRRGASDSG
jgi:WS/DGAT/MGAT family acyltransferase